MSVVYQGHSSIIIVKNWIRMVKEVRGQGQDTRKTSRIALTTPALLLGCIKKIKKEVHIPGESSAPEVIIITEKSYAIVAGAFVSILS